MSGVPRTCLWTSLFYGVQWTSERCLKVARLNMAPFLLLYIYPLKFKCLPHVMVQEQLVCDDSRASYEVTNSISLRMADTSSVAKALDEAELTEDNIPCSALTDPLDSHTVPTLEWWLLGHCIHAHEAWFHLRVYEMLVSIVAFYWDHLESNARRMKCPLRMYCHIQHINLQAFWHTTHWSLGIWYFHNSLQEHCRHSIHMLQAFNFVYIFSKLC